MKTIDVYGTTEAPVTVGVDLTEDHLQDLKKIVGRAVLVGGVHLSLNDVGNYNGCLTLLPVPKWEISRPDDP